MYLDLKDTDGRITTTDEGVRKALLLHYAQLLTELGGGEVDRQDPRLQPRIDFTIDHGDYDEERTSSDVYVVGSEAIVVMEWDTDDDEFVTGTIFGVRLMEDGWKVCDRYFRFSDCGPRELDEEYARYLHLQMRGRHIAHH